MKSQAKPLMIQGTMSNVGKSLITAALCRIFMRDGLRVAPFKSQNMALNSFVTPDGFEIGRAQAMQAEAAGKDADVRMNPILLKPMWDSMSQVILNGEPYKNMNSADYYAAKKNFIPHILEAYESLAAENDAIIIEGAGSPAEINLNDNDIVNMGLAEMLRAPVILTADIDRGGVFASLFGTVALLPKYKNYFKGSIINKFRGDISLLAPALDGFAKTLGFPFLGVVPYLSVDIDDEDSLACGFNENKSKDCDVDIAVIKLPRISNFTDMQALSAFSGVSVRYVSKKGRLAGADLIIIPGTKNTLGDLRFLKESGIFEDIKTAAGRGVPVIGLCGGYQMMGKIIFDPDGVEGGGTEAGFGFFNSETVFSDDKRRTRVKGKFKGIDGFFDFLNDISFVGYEIHMGKTKGVLDEIIKLNEPSTGGTLGEAKGNFFGTYVHGVFDEHATSQALIGAICKAKKLPLKTAQALSRKAQKEAEYDELANAVKAALDMDKIYAILEKGI